MIRFSNITRLLKTRSLSNLLGPTIDDDHYTHWSSKYHSLIRLRRRNLFYHLMISSNWFGTLLKHEITNFKNILWAFRYESIPKNELSNRLTFILSTAFWSLRSGSAHGDHPAIISTPPPIQSWQASQTETWED